MERWFYTGQKMPDGTPISIAARNSAEEEEFMKKGLEAVPPHKKEKVKAPKRGGSGREI